VCRPAFALAILVSAACAQEEPASNELENGSFMMESGPYTIHYEVHGRGPVLMTVPNSWGLSLAGLRSMYRPLEEHVTMVYFDPRGMGESGPAREESDLGPDAVRADFHALQKHLGLEKVNVIGWSNGATNLVLLASETPEAFSAAIFVHGNASFALEDGKTMAESYPKLVKSFAEFRKEMAEAHYTPAEEKARVKEFDTEVWFPWMFADHEAGKATLPEVFRDAEFSWAHAQYTNQQWDLIDFRDRLPNIAARSLVVAGRHDMLPPEKVKEIADGIADSRFVVFEQSGHFAPVEEREKFVRTVVDFLELPPE
jgi:proline iminopeptidase